MVIKLEWFYNRNKVYTIKQNLKRYFLMLSLENEILHVCNQIDITCKSGTV